ncbi:MAG TPA: hypothetical protein VJN96_15705 [Vicinamibacterales bacterium]|nr:hypothetical protein [Vicinamibacterales bacterium]
MGPAIKPVAAIAAALVLSVAAPRARQELSRKDATSMEQKLVAIAARGSTAPKTKLPPVRTSFTEQEINALFQYSQLVQMPAGVLNPRVTIADGGLLTGRATVDLDAIRKSKERGMLDPLSYVTGSVEVTAVGTLKTANGQGTFDLQSATLGGVSIPKSLLQELVSYYSRTPETPNGFTLDKPFVLPAAIQAVETRRGAATVVQ